MLTKEKIEWFKKHPIKAAENFLNIKLTWYQKTLLKFVNGSTIICDFNQRRRHKISPEIWEYWQSIMNEINEGEKK